MWVAVALSESDSGWKKLASGGDLNELKQMDFGSSAHGRVYYFWDAPFPSEPVKLQRLYEQIVAANGGIEVRVMVGASISRLNADEPNALCSGQCFCVVQGSSRRCEVCYQGGGGPQCVPCGSSC